MKKKQQQFRKPADRTEDVVRANLADIKLIAVAGMAVAGGPHRRDRSRRPRQAGESARRAPHPAQDPAAFHLERLRPAEVTDVPEVWRAGTTPETLRPGECFFRSFRYVSEHFASGVPMWLVHGEYLLGARHAWVELPDAVVFDGVMQRFYRRDAYYSIQVARAWYKFESPAALIIAANLTVGEDGLVPYGAWDVILKLPWADPDNPTMIDADRATDLLVTSGLRPDLAGFCRRKRARPAAPRAKRGGDRGLRGGCLRAAWSSERPGAGPTAAASGQAEPPGFRPEHEGP
jgi:hypothetical protein